MRILISSPLLPDFLKDADAFWEDTILYLRPLQPRTKAGMREAITFRTRFLLVALSAVPLRKRGYYRFYAIVVSVNLITITNSI